MWTYFPELRPRSLEHLRTIYERREHGSRDSSEIWLNYECRERAGGCIAGEVQATIYARAGVAYVAYAIFRDFQRKGFAREAVAALINHVREEYHIARFIAEMDTRNEASYKLAESLGFFRVETHEGVEHGHGVIADEYVYELTLDQ
jgi:RimJ/RimL family protein N-acetyltransferase